MTIEETQRAYCEALGVPYDESCITPERMLFITDKASEIYRSPHWYEVLPQEELKKRRQAYLDRGLTIDGRTGKVNSLQLTVNSNDKNNESNRLPGSDSHHAVSTGSAIQPAQPCDSNAAHAAHLSPAGTHQDAVAVASGKNLAAFDLFRNAAGLKDVDINTPGSRHSSLLAIMSAGASRVMPEDELKAVVAQKMPAFSQEHDCQQLIHDFYAKYGDSSKPMSQAVIRINAQAERSSQKDAVALKNESSEGGTDINAEDENSLRLRCPNISQTRGAAAIKDPGRLQASRGTRHLPATCDTPLQDHLQVYRQRGARGYPDVLSAGGYGRRQELCADAYQHDYGGHQTARP